MAFEIVTIEGTVAACNGDGGPLGHPKVYLNLAPIGRAECPYCSRVFVNRAIAAAEPAADQPTAAPASAPSAPGAEASSDE